jgi:DNA-binding MarR family transcriptional regulator
MSETSAPDAVTLQAHISAFVRAFGLHQPDQTPCGQPIPVSEAHALAELNRDGPLSQVDLGARLRLEKSTVSRLVGQLIGRGWVHRSRRDGDARLVWLELTDTGRRAAAELGTARAARFERLLAAIPADRRQHVVDALTLLVEASRDHPDHAR